MNSIKVKNLYGKSVKISIVNDESKANFITHSGTFHADEVMATCILLNKFGNIKLFRTNNVTNNKAFVYDIGYGKYDHHQLDYNEMRDNKIKYASCGLIWRAFGKDILSKYDDELFDKIDKKLIMDIDRDDNGQSLEDKTNAMVQTLPSLIGSFNPAWDEEGCESKNFLDAISFANKVLNNCVHKTRAQLKAKTIIEKKIEESNDGILILDSYMPWKDVVLSSSNPKAETILYAVFPSKRGGYNVVGTPDKKDNFKVKKPFPSNWGGLGIDELRQVSKVDTITFCHKGLFICACKTYDDAIKIAKISIENK